MQSLFEKTWYENVISRIAKISAGTQPLWGKMDASQMMHHLNMTMEAPLGKLAAQGKPIFIMRIFKSVLYNDKPFGKGNPTPKQFKVTGSFDFDMEKEKVLENIQEIYSRGPEANYEPHVFFGKLNNDQWGKHFYKHLDHHLRQFGV